MWVVSFVSGSLPQGKRSVVSCVYVFWKEQHCRTFGKMFTKCESPQEQETVVKSRLRVGVLLLVFRWKQHLRSWHQNVWQYPWLICLSLSINWVILMHTALETVCVCVSVCVSVCLSVCLSVRPSVRLQAGRRKRNFTLLCPFGWANIFLSSLGCANIFLVL